MEAIFYSYFSEGKISFVYTGDCFVKRPLPIGVSDFKKIIEGDYAYVDKTLLIQELIERGVEVALIPRPRRFGKTLNLSMLRYFFEKTEEDTSYLFKNLNIWKNKSREMQGQFPVIFITLKDVKHASWQETFEALRALVAREFQRHRYLLDGEVLEPEEKAKYLRIVREEGDQVLLGNSLFQLTEWMYRYHKRKIILLIDEYDTPAQAAFVGNYYDHLISFLRNWLSGALKDNSYLEKGVLTGVLRIAKESIFSGLNNITVFSLLNQGFQDKFGLLEPEVAKLLEDYELPNRLPEIRQWYDGYRIGSCVGIYNPWSVLTCIMQQGDLAPYWVNTSDNALMKQLITEGTDDLKADIEELLRGGIIKKTIEEGIIFSDLKKNPDTVWSLLLFSGYLTIATTPSYGTPCQLRIPNQEVGGLYRSMVLNWFKESIREPKYRLLLDSLINGDIDSFSQIFKEFLISSFSVFDITQKEPERVYHAFVLGILVGLKDRYQVKSNRESGLGKYDVVLFPQDPSDLGVVMEFKKAENADEATLEAAARSAIQQIEKKQYAQELLDRGIKRILYLGFAFSGKAVHINHKFEDK